MITAPEDWRRYDSHDMPLFACANYPDADRPGLELVSDWVSWWSIWNDFPDDPEFVQEPGRAEEFFSSLTALLEPSPPAPTDPHTRAFADIWRRWCAGRSETFVARTRQNWSDWFASYATRSRHRREETHLGVAEYLTLRDLTGAVQLQMDAAERTGGYEVPPTVLESPSVQAMRRATIRVINITQDVQSLAKEEAAGDQHNMVLVLERQKGLPRRDVLEHIHRMMRGYTDSFLENEAALPPLLDHLGVPVNDRSPIYRYAADLRSQMRGAADFCSVSGRYQ
ncbi:terpene synthase family protein [Streptomyces cellulosae]